MNIKVGFFNETRETNGSEKRVALVPSSAQKLVEQDVQVVMEQGAGVASGHLDAGFADVGVHIVKTSEHVINECEILLRVSPWTSATGLLLSDRVLIGFLAPFGSPEGVKALRDKHVSSFAMELVPRTTRAQSMDGLSSQRSVVGYKGLLIGAEKLNRFFPMLTTPAGTVRPAMVLVVGTGVAGLQAIATARRLGANVVAQDVRSESREQVESLGAKFVSAEVDASGSGGYARELTEEEKTKQAAQLTKIFAEADLVVTTAAIPGMRAPVIVTRNIVEAMKPGAVIVDCVAEDGGNCELTKPGETIEHNGVIVCGPLNIPSMLSYHASEMYSKNLANFLNLIIDSGEINLNFDDDIVKESCLTHDGNVLNQRVAQILGDSPGGNGNE